MRVMIDTMIHDALIAEPETMSQLERLIAVGAVVLLTTHIQQDQLADIGDDALRERTTSIQANKIATSAFVFDVSKWDEAEWGTEEANATVTALAGNNPKHLPDALIGVTAASVADVLVTNDCKLTKRLRRERPALRIVDFDGFSRLIQDLSSHYRF